MYESEMNRSRHLIEQGDFAAAEDLLEHILADAESGRENQSKFLSSQQMLDCLTALCQIRYKQERYQECLNTFEKVRQVAPQSIPGLSQYYASTAFLLAREQAARGLNKEAAASFTRARDISNEFLSIDHALRQQIDKEHREFSEQQIRERNRQAQESQEDSKSNPSLAANSSKRRPVNYRPTESPIAAERRRSEPLVGVPNTNSFDVVSTFLRSPAIFTNITIILILVSIQLASQVLAVKASVSSLEGMTFQTVDGVLGLRFINSNIADYKSLNQTDRVIYRDLDRDPQDLLSFIPGSLAHKEVWLARDKTTLTTGDGTVFYKTDAPENILTGIMWKYAHFAAEKYAQRRAFPAKLDPTDPETQFLHFVNPVTGTATIAMLLSGSSPGDQTWGSRSAQGEKWPGEPDSMSAGSIVCLNVGNCRFLIRGRDSKGKMLPSSQAGRVFVIEMVDGKTVTKEPEASSLNSKETASATKNPPNPKTATRLYVSAKGELQTIVAAVRLAVPLLLFLSMAIEMIWSANFLRKESDLGRMAFCAVLVLSSAALCVVWFVIAIG